MTYKLTYWAKRGRGEQIRLLLEELRQPYQEIHVSRGGSLEQLQAEGPGTLAFGSIPLLEDGDFKLVQGPTIMSYLARKHAIAPDGLELSSKADAVVLGAEDLRIRYFGLFGQDAATKQRQFVETWWKERWLPCLSGLLELNGDTGFFVGATLSHADIAVWDILDSMTTWVAGATLRDYPRLVQFFLEIQSRPRIAAYLESDRRPKS